MDLTQNTIQGYKPDKQVNSAHTLNIDQGLFDHFHGDNTREGKKATAPPLSLSLSQPPTSRPPPEPPTSCSVCLIAGGVVI